MSEDREDIRSESGLQISSMIDKIMANPELISMVASALGGGSKSSESGESAEPAREEPVRAETLPSMERLPELVAALSPMLSAQGSSPSPRGKLSTPSDKRACLLTALKPYMSRERCEAIDYMIRLGALSEVFRGLGG